MTTVALMYHGIFSDQHPASAMPAEDLPYAVSVEMFERHLQLFRGKDVLLTFDDGDAGWYHSALPLLKTYQRQGLFFVTPGLIGTPGYCSWEQLHELTAAGHRLGTHGLTHRFLPDLDEKECLRELMQSRAELEMYAGATVDTLSFPGGRFGRRELRLATLAGYRHCYTSRPGMLYPERMLLNRVAIRATTADDWLEGLLARNTRVWSRLLFGYGVRALLKRMLGNQVYHGIYRLLRS